MEVEEEREKKEIRKKKVVDAKPEIRMPHRPPSDGRATKMIRTPP
jgi:hypothetical protein